MIKVLSHQGSIQIRFIDTETQLIAPRCLNHDYRDKEYPIGSEVKGAKIVTIEGNNTVQFKDENIQQAYARTWGKDAYIEACEKGHLEDIYKHLKT